LPVTSAFIVPTACGGGSVPSSIARVNAVGARFVSPAASISSRGRLRVRDRPACERALDAATSCWRAGASEESAQAGTVGGRVRRVGTLELGAIAPAMRGSFGMSYQSADSRPSVHAETSAIVRTLRCALGAAASSFVMKAS